MSITSNRSSPVQVQGYSTNTAINPKLVPGSWKQLSVGPNHVLAIRNDGRLYAWGQNTYGQLGNNTLTTYSSPVQIGTNIWKNVSAGLNYSLGIDGNGLLYAWGNGNLGQLANNGYVVGNYWKKVVPTQNMTYAIRNDGTLWAWGYNSYGELGQNDIIARSSPVQIGTNNDTWLDVAGGTNFGLALKSNNTLWAWGYNGYGNLGQGDTVNRSSPVQIGTSSWIFIAATPFNTQSAYAINIYNQLFSWGQNSYGMLAIGSLSAPSTPQQVIYGPGLWTKVSANGGTALFLAYDKTLWAAGYNGYGQLGNNAVTSVVTMVQVGNNNIWTNIASGSSFSMALDGSGGLYTWGYNGYGQLGDGSTNSRSSPVQISTGSWTNISAGDNVAIATRFDGSLFTWGY